MKNELKPIANHGELLPPPSPVYENIKAMNTFIDNLLLVKSKAAIYRKPFIKKWQLKIIRQHMVHF
jgi:hypothetical protein